MQRSFSSDGELCQTILYENEVLTSQQSIMRRTESPAAQHGLIRAMTRWDVAALCVNGIIGAGIFGLPSAVARLLGVWSPLAFVICGIVVYIFVLCFAEASSRFTGNGGPYLYSRAVFGPFIAFEVGWAMWLARVSGFAANSNLLVSYLGSFIPQVTSGTGRAVVLIGVPVVLMIVNIRGVTGGAHIGTAFAAVKVGALMLFGIAGLAAVDWSRFSAASSPVQGDWGAAVLLLIYAYTGFENSVIPAGEARDPVRDLRWGMFIGLGACAVLYLIVQIVAFGTLPDLAQSERPLVDSAQSFAGPIGAGIISFLVCVSVIGNLSATALAVPRLTYAFAERGDFPAVFGKLHAVYRTPVVSIALFSVIAMILAVSGTFIWLVTVSVVARLAAYLITCMAVPLLRRREVAAAAFKIPAGPVIPLIGVGVCVWLLSRAAVGDLRDFAMASLIGAALYGLTRRHLSRSLD
jgi:basic amino acid/polyamine antiporter, APA family